MATAEQMAAYAAALRQYKPAQDKPVTEVAIFKLKEAQSAATLEYFERQIIQNTAPGTGIIRQSYGFSLSDPYTLIWMLDWEKIQDHWDFWQTPAFAPVIVCIDKIFVSGRPLVRHYEFQPSGMLRHSVQKVFVWNDELEAPKAESLVGTKSNASDRKVAYAVDMQETSWRCAVFGYENKETAHKDEFVEWEGLEAHLVELAFVEKPTQTMKAGFDMAKHGKLYLHSFKRT
ncbi:hypothetical protein COCVIDRAFT_21322 [Bipolaris victoriae FI3]|uniref:ABM domain-containing protein n=1 Tax=Bipolaris victoriae (strain FI3) TaxID=930091 RepID=W7E935_BIPV3|nr:hypothetical protein COCVIDRAFT_21322 [Bipolaris victoriae FI3]